ncbi:MAG: hypothetical protein JWM37_696 [Candidatus Saccharibacteria bacterium]|nr:hypothetical protein [Candidatus Saccharibacteria bacterium]
MKKILKLALSFALITPGVLLACLGVPSPALAEAGQVYLSPAAASTKKGDAVIIQLRVTPGGSIDSVEAKITYDPAKLQFLKATFGGTAFNAQLEQKQADGTINVSRGSTTGAISTDALIEVLAFKALVADGTTGISISDANATSAGESMSYGTAGTTVSLLPSDGQSNIRSLTPAAISKETVKYNQAMISISLKQAAQAYIMYGFSKDELVYTTPLTDSGSTHTITLGSDALVPGSSYNYAVVTQDAFGNTAQSETRQFKLKGLTVRVAAYDVNRQPLKRTTLELRGPTTLKVKTDKTGVATFNDVSPGNQAIVFKTGGKEYSQTLSIVDNVATDGNTQTSDTQTFSVVYEVKPSSLGWLRLVFIGVIILIALGVIITLGLRLRKSVASPNTAVNPTVYQGQPGVPPQVYDIYNQPPQNNGNDIRYHDDNNRRF